LNFLTSSSVFKINISYEFILIIGNHFKNNIAILTIVTYCVDSTLINNLPGPD